MPNRPLPSAQTYWDRWSRGMGSAETAQRITAGVNRLTQAPSVAATQQTAIDRMRVRWLASITSGKWARNTAAITLQQYQQAMIQKGLPAITASLGLQRTQTKVTNFAQQLLAYEASALQVVRQLPNTTLAERRQRMNEWFTQMSLYNGPNPQ